MHLGVIGYGNITQTLLELLAQPGAPAVTRVTLLVRPGKTAAAAAAAASGALPVAAVEDAAALIAAGPDLVVESAGHAGVAAHVPAVLRAGIDTVVVSIGALSDDALTAELKAAAQAGDARIVLPAGAVGGIDLLSSLSASGPVEVTYRGIKPPMAWAGTPAEAATDLASLDHPLVFFEGSAREAAAQFPKNANVAATLALAGPGLDATRVELIADPAASGNIHAYEVRSPVANYSMKIENLPSAGNAKTSVSTIYSVLREIRNRLAVVSI
ncbi:MAG: aspartate dehydrogenase [Pseudodonghicola sp.]